MVCYVIYKCHAVDLELSLRAGIVACINSTAVILRLDRGIQFKILNIFYCFLDTVVKPRYDTECVFRFTQQCLASSRRLRGNLVKYPEITS
nr:palindromic element RPE4 domain-containing protein [Rickettsia monacensis]